MKKNVLIKQQVKDFIQTLSPDPKKALRQGLKGLENEEGNIEPLDGDLEGYYRLRVKNFRVIFSRPDPSTILCEYVHYRKVVYVNWTRLILEQ
jgi:mRNA-degrading endonuclease RelE of RelBE toxin-antitoxin system